MSIPDKEPMLPEDLHEWVSFEDSLEDRTWVFDATFLTSPWTCIYGRGCQGVLTGPAEELEQGCCSYGAHFVDEEDESVTLAHAERLTAEQWQHRDVARRRGGATKVNAAGEIKSRLVDGACIFLNRPGFEYLTRPWVLACHPARDGARGNAQCFREARLAHELAHRRGGWVWQGEHCGG